MSFGNHRRDNEGRPRGNIFRRNKGAQPRCLHLGESQAEGQGQMDCTADGGRRSAQRHAAQGLLEPRGLSDTGRRPRDILQDRQERERLDRLDGALQGRRKDVVEAHAAAERLSWTGEEQTRNEQGQTHRPDKHREKRMAPLL